MTTLPIDILIGCLVGASSALTAERRLFDQPLTRSPAMGAVVVMALTLLLPLSIFMGWRYPDWSVLYLFARRALPGEGWWLSLLVPLAAGLGFAAARHALRRERKRDLLIALTVVVGGGVMVVGAAWPRLMVVGSTGRFRLSPLAVRPIEETSLPFFLAATIAATLLGWATTWWRLRMFVQAVTAQKEPKRTPPRANAPQKTKPLPAKRRPLVKKKTKKRA